MEDSGSRCVSNEHSGTSSWWHVVKPFANGGAARVLQAFLCERPYQHPEKIILMKVPGGMVLSSMPYALMFGSYETLRRKALSANGGMPLPFNQEVKCGLLAATSAALAVVPTLKIEKLIVADAALPAAQRVNYRSAGHAISCIVEKDGISALWKNRLAAALITLHITTFLVSYNQSFCYLKDSAHVSEPCARLGAILVSGLAPPICCAPIINVASLLLSIKSQARQRPRPISASDMLKFQGRFKIYANLSNYLFIWAPFSMALLVMRDVLQGMEGLNGR